jgi:glycosyltransferase involved in cell wall biosynthesis
VTASFKIRWRAPNYGLMRSLHPPRVTGADVCVVIAVKNGARFLAEAIESVLAQQDVDLTLRVLDNRSTDDSVAIAERYCRDDRVSVEVNPDDFQYYGSLNRALASTEAKYFAPFAHDDVMLPGNLARKVELLEATSAGFAHSNGTQIDVDGRPVGTWPDHRATPECLPAPDFFNYIVPSNQVCCQAVVARTDALRAIGGFDARSLFAGDWLTWLRLALRWPVVTIAEPLVGNRVHATAGTLVSRSNGYHARDVPATLDRVFRDKAMPAGWFASRDALVAASHAEMAICVNREGFRRVADGWAEYLVLGRALARQPHDQGLQARYRDSVLAAGLVPPRTPWQAVARGPDTAADAEELARTVAELGPLIAALFLAVPANLVDSRLALLEPYFGAHALDVAIVPTDDVRELYAPGRVVLAGWQSDDVVAAEAAGLPVHAIALPDQFREAPDPARWQIIDPALALP